MERWFGAIVLGAWGLWHAIGSLWAEADLPMFIKLAIFALGTGTLVLFVSIAREKLFKDLGVENFMQ